MSDIDETDLRDEVSKSVILKFLMVLFGFLANIIFARILGPGGFGELYLTYMIFYILVSVSHGISGAVVQKKSNKNNSSPEIFGAGVLPVSPIKIGSIYLR